MAKALRIKVKVLGLMREERWCDVCLVTAFHIRLALKIGPYGGDQVNLLYCVRGNHQIEIA